MITPQQRWLLLASTGFLLLTISPPAAAEVMDSILDKDCTNYFLNKAPPEVPGILIGGQILDQSRYKPICQTYKNERRFVTLYDTENKIPVFSAYKFRGKTGNQGAKRFWMIEPQLEDRNTNNMRVDRYVHQAGDYHYTNTGTQYNRGHLYPMCHGYSKDDKESTCALTNVVPQAITFNGGSWEKMETCVQCVLDKYCRNNNNKVEAFVIVGAQPSANNKLKDWVNIPEVLWTAFCCYSRTKGKWLASAHWGANVQEVPGSKYMQTKTLAELEQQLSSNGSPFKAFPESMCPRHETVTEFYPEMNAKCHCPKEATTTSAPTTTVPSTTSVSTPSTTLPTTEETATTTLPTTTPTTTTTTSTTTTTTRTTTKKKDGKKNKETHEQGENQGRPGRGGGANAGGVVGGILQGLLGAITGVVGTLGAAAGAGAGAAAAGAGAAAAGAGGSVGGVSLGAGGAGAGGAGGSVGGVSLGAGGAGTGGAGGSVSGVSGGAGAGGGGAGGSVGGVSGGAGAGAGAGGGGVSTGKVALGVGGSVIGGGAVIGGIVAGVIESQKNRSVTSQTPTRASDPFVSSDFNTSAKDGINPTVTVPPRTNTPSMRLTSAAMTSATTSSKNTPMPIFPSTNKPLSNTTDETSTTNQTTTESTFGKINKTSISTMTTTSDPPFNMTNHTLEATNTTSSDPPSTETKWTYLAYIQHFLNRIVKKPMTYLKHSFEQVFNQHPESSEIPSTTESTFGMTNEASIATMTTTSDPPFNMTNHTLATTNATSADPPSKKTKWTFSEYIQHFLSPIIKKPTTYSKHSFEQVLNQHPKSSEIPPTTEPTFGRTNKATTNTMTTTSDPLQQQPFSSERQAFAHLLNTRQRRPPRRFQRPGYRTLSRYSRNKRPFLQPKHEREFLDHPINLDIPH